MTEQFREPRTSNEPPPRAADKESWLLRTGLSISVWTLAGVATILAATGQAKFARWAGIADIRAYAVPAVLELVAVAFLLIGYRRVRRGDSASCCGCSPPWLVGLPCTPTSCTPVGAPGSCSAPRLRSRCCCGSSSYAMTTATSNGTRVRPLARVPNWVFCGSLLPACPPGPGSSQLDPESPQWTKQSDTPKSGERSTRTRQTGHAVGPSAIATASAPSVRDRVYAFLDAQVGIDAYPDAEYGDDPYPQWLTAQGLGLDIETVRSVRAGMVPPGRPATRRLRPRIPTIRPVADRTTVTPSESSVRSLTP